MCPWSRARGSHSNHHSCSATSPHGHVTERLGLPVSQTCAHTSSDTTQVRAARDEHALPPPRPGHRSGSHRHRRLVGRATPGSTTAKSPTAPHRPRRGTVDLLPAPRTSRSEASTWGRTSASIATTSSGAHRESSRPSAARCERVSGALTCAHRLQQRRGGQRREDRGLLAVRTRDVPEAADEREVQARRCLPDHRGVREPHAKGKTSTAVPDGTWAPAVENHLGTVTGSTRKGTV